MKPLYQLSLCLALLSPSLLAWSADDIVIGQTADLSSMAGKQMKDFNAGALAYFSAVNARGGVKGRLIRLDSRDDAFSADKAAVNAKALIDDGVLALFASRGTDPSEAVMKVASAHKVPLVAPITGADSVRENPYAYPVRASYRDEVEKMLKHIAIIPTRLALVVQDDKFGNPLANYIDMLLQQKYRGITLVSRVKFARKQPDLAQQASTVLEANANAVIALCNPTSCESFIRNLHDQAKARAKPRPTVYQTSISDMYSQFKKLGPEVVTGSPYSQILPDPNRGVSPLVREYRIAMGRANVPVNYRTYEGYFSAAVLTEALKRSRTLSRSDLTQTLNEGMVEGVELGDVSVRYEPGGRRGSSYVDLVTIDRYGRLVR